MSKDKHSLISLSPFILPTSFANTGRSLDEPAPTLLASRRHHYIVNPSHGGHSTSPESPCPVIIARQDKAPLYLVTAEEGTFQIPIYEDDSSIMVQIKEFMATYNIADIKMRMLKVVELLRIQGFSEEYKMQGTQTEQKKFIGNSVVPHVPQHWCEAMAYQFKNFKVAI